MNIAVYCSSSNHIGSEYLESAELLGKWIARAKHTLVFGGATGGSMTAVSEGTYSENGKIIGVIPVAVVKMNRQSPYCTELIEVESMDIRKSKMKELSDIFVVLPGSFGTLDELFDVTASAIVGEHKRPVIVVNQNGIFDDLIHLTTRLKSEKFIPVNIFEPVFVNDIQACIQLLEQHV